MLIASLKRNDFGEFEPESIIIDFEIASITSYS